MFHRDLKPKNILANSDCKLKICDFGLARPAFTDTPTTVFWTDYVATRWYRAPELCGCFFTKVRWLQMGVRRCHSHTHPPLPQYSKTIDVWSVGCIFAEILSGKPLFPGRNVVHQLELITDLLGTPSPEEVAAVRNEKARRFLQQMPPKPAQSMEARFPKAQPAALRLLERLIAFDPHKRPSAEEALTDPYFAGLHNAGREPTAEPISKLEFEFEKHKLSCDDVRDLIYREVLEYHPQAKREYLQGETSSRFMFPSAVDHFRRQFARLEGEGPGGGPGLGGGRDLRRQAASLPREHSVHTHEHSALGAPRNMARSDTIGTHTPTKAGADAAPAGPDSMEA